MHHFLHLSFALNLKRKIFSMPISTVELIRANVFCVWHQKFRPINRTLKILFVYFVGFTQDCLQLDLYRETWTMCSQVSVCISMQYIIDFIDCKLTKKFNLPLHRLLLSTLLPTCHNFLFKVFPRQCNMIFILWV